jgi:hypothetical protein
MTTTHAVAHRSIAPSNSVAPAAHDRRAAPTSHADDRRVPVPAPTDVHAAAPVHDARRGAAGGTPSSGAGGAAGATTQGGGTEPAAPVGLDQAGRSALIDRGDAHIRRLAARLGLSPTVIDAKLQLVHFDVILIGALKGAVTAEDITGLYRQLRAELRATPVEPTPEPTSGGAQGAGGAEGVPTH